MTVNNIYLGSFSDFWVVFDSFWHFFLIISFGNLFDNFFSFFEMKPKKWNLNKYRMVLINISLF